MQALPLTPRRNGFARSGRGRCTRILSAGVLPILDRFLSPVAQDRGDADVKPRLARCFRRLPEALQGVGPVAKAPLHLAQEPRQPSWRS
jgi:hypothetical protein